VYDDSGASQLGMPAGQGAREHKHAGKIRGWLPQRSRWRVPELYADPDMTLFVWYRYRAHFRGVVAFQILWPTTR